MSQQLPDWMVPPRPEGWLATDLDQLPQAPRHTEIWDGALVFVMSPQREWHRLMIAGLERALNDQAPAGSRAISEMTLLLDDRTRPEPDLVVTTAAPDRDRTYYLPHQVSLVVEVVSPESAHRDRAVKPARYAAAGIANFWRIEEDSDTGTTVLYGYELDTASGTYLPPAQSRGQLRTGRPFPIVIDLDSFVR